MDKPWALIAANFVILAAIVGGLISLYGFIATKVGKLLRKRSSEIPEWVEPGPTNPSLWRDGHDK